MPSGDEARNHAPRSMAFWTYLGVITSGGISIVATSLMRLGGHDFTVMGSAFVVVAALLLLCELRPLMTAGPPCAQRGNLSTPLVFPPLLPLGLRGAPALPTVGAIP